MTEVLPQHNPELLPAERIGAAMDWWLREEIKNSNAAGSRNVYLNDYGTFFETGSAKAISHTDRVIVATKMFEGKHVRDLRTIALQLFHVMMGLSAAYRTDCYLMSNDAEDYMKRRASIGTDPLSIPLQSTVSKRLSLIFDSSPSEDDLAIPRISTDEMREKTFAVNQLRSTVHGAIHSDADYKAEGHRFGHHRRLRNLQRDWLNLGVDYVVHAAEVGGGKLEPVIFREPKTITEAREFHPFLASEFAPVFADRGVDSQLDG